jgi:hypothetical protein
LRVAFPHCLDTRYDECLVALRGARHVDGDALERPIKPPASSERKSLAKFRAVVLLQYHFAHPKNCRLHRLQHLEFVFFQECSLSRLVRPTSRNRSFLESAVVTRPVTGCSSPLLPGRVHIERSYVEWADGWSGRPGLCVWCELACVCAPLPVCADLARALRFFGEAVQPSASSTSTSGGHIAGHIQRDTQRHTGRAHSSD